MLSDEMIRCIDTCIACYKTCTNMAMNHYLEMGGMHVEPAHFKLMMGCGEMCRFAAHFMLIDAQHYKHTCSQCAESCTECAKDCKRVGDMEECVAACEACAESCRKMAA